MKNAKEEDLDNCKNLDVKWFCCNLFIGTFPNPKSKNSLIVQFLFLCVSWKINTGGKKTSASHFLPQPKKFFTWLAKAKVSQLLSPHFDTDCLIYSPKLVPISLPLYDEYPVGTRAKLQRHLMKGVKWLRIAGWVKAKTLNQLLLYKPAYEEKKTLWIFKCKTLGNSSPRIP